MRYPGWARRPSSRGVVRAPFVYIWDAASSANETSADSMLSLWQLGLCMVPSSLWAATEHPPAQTGMNAQSPQLFQAASESKSAAARR